MSYNTLINIVISFLLISLIHYLYVFFSHRDVLSMTSNLQKTHININNDILDAINIIEDTDTELPSVEYNIVVEDIPVNMENELDNFLKKLT
jgi:hypothetical protein